MTAQSEPEALNDFASRHIGTSPAEQASMLGVLGYPSLKALVDAAVPPSIRMTERLALPPALSEPQVLSELRSIASQNKTWTNLIGMGYYASFLPPVIERNVLESPAWYTAYTPYQAEISQGRLEALLNFQTMVSDLTALPIANASMLDEATAAAEAMSMCRAASKASSTSKTTGGSFFVDQMCHPQTIDVVRTRADARGIDIVVGDPGVDLEASGCFGVVIQ
ncbi:MAG: glycine dehydrogenase (aminomethyl-transferring), partial [Acidimicrobiales bacterium]